MALAGMPPREELFSANVCGGTNGGRDPHGPEIVSAKPYHDRASGDVLVALSHGTISRYHVASGKRIWQHHDEMRFPTWGSYDGSDTAVVVPLSVGRRMTDSTIRPVLITGETGMTLVSAQGGSILAYTKYPQLVTRSRPVLVDVSGDGTDDVLVRSQDAVWGYHVVVTHGGGASTLFRICVGLLLMGMILALLKNRYNHNTTTTPQNNNNKNYHQYDKRSTDPY
uniref:Uncharacterized protein n=1 Tax=Cyclophora tenuis TaxID=216820 RepID=A0A7S1CW18_CYCTE